MTTLSLNLNHFGSDALRNLAYAIAGADGQTRAEKRSLYLQLMVCIKELESRHLGGNTDELREMAEIRKHYIETSRRYVGNPARDGMLAARDR